jgi:hypothetical protein
MSLPALPVTADSRVIAERVNVLIRAHNLQRSSRTVAQLTAAADTALGERTFVTDATATTFRSIVVGGGSNLVPVYFDGTDWRIG